MNPAGEMERRCWRGEIRAEGAGDGPRTLRGYAALYDSDSADLGGFVERIAPGAFASAFKPDADIRAFWNHDTGLVLGRTVAGTLRLADHARGLHVEIDLPATSWARDAAESIRRGDVSQMSFGFRVVRDSWEDDRNTGRVVRTLLEVQLFEVSPVSIPAYAETTVSARSRSGPATVQGLQNLYHARMRLLGLQARSAGVE